MAQETLTDLQARWARARRAALLEVAAEPAGPMDAGAEDELVQRAIAKDREATMRRVFENSARLGASFRAYHRHTLALGELPAALSVLGSPCLRGAWSELSPPAPRDAPALRLERPACEGASADVCDLWREAIDGLVLGLTDGARHARHRSAGHGDLSCVDIVMTDPESPLRYGDIPNEMSAGLAAVRRSARLLGGVDVTFLGVSEGVLLYEVKRQGCAGSDIDWTPLVEGGVHKRFPALKTQEISPRPVIAAE